MSEAATIKAINAIRAIIASAPVLPIMPLGYQFAVNSAFSFSEANDSGEIVAVHGSEPLDEGFNFPLRPALRRHPALPHNLFKLVKTFDSTHCCTKNVFRGVWAGQV